MLDTSITDNLKIAEETLSGEPDQCVSFLKSQSIGIATLSCLRILQKPNPHLQLDLLNNIIRTFIIPQVLVQNEIPTGLFDGAAGTLYTLLVLLKKLKEVFNQDSIKELQFFISEVISSLVHTIEKNNVEESAVQNVTMTSYNSS